MTELIIWTMLTDLLFDDGLCRVLYAGKMIENPVRPTINNQNQNFQWFCTVTLIVASLYLKILSGKQIDNR